MSMLIRYPSRASVTAALAVSACLVATAPAAMAGSVVIPGRTATPAPMFHGKQVDLVDISATGPDDIWATGVAFNVQPLVLHWDGTRWSTSVLGGDDMGFEAITALSATDVWAVGFDYSQYGTTLIEHWDGSSWTRVDAPTEPDTTFVLMAADFISPDDGYAFGALGSEDIRRPEQAELSGGNGDAKPAWDSYVTLHWDGTSWSQVRTNGVEYEALSATSPTDAWMVGRAADGTTITRHWDGSTWTVVASPSRGTDNDLVAVEEISPNDVWAAGDAYEHGTYALHWDGTKWKLIADAATRPADTMDIDGTSGHDVWMSGVQGATRGLLEHWDGHSWTSVDTGTTGLQQPQIQAVATLSPTDAWAVGEYFLSRGHQYYQRRLILHWDGTAWTRLSS